MSNPKDLDQTGIFGEFKRMARASSTVGGIATRVIGNKLGLKSNQAIHANDLRAALGGLKGPLMKALRFSRPFPAPARGICEPACRVAG